MTPHPLFPFIAVIKGQTKKQMIKFCKKTNFEQFFNGCYRYLKVKPPKTVIHINASGRCIFYSINLKFYEKARFCICDTIQFFSTVNGGDGGVKNKMLNNGSILTKRKYVVQIYKIKLHTKNHIDWIKNEVPKEVQSLLYNLIPGSW